MTFFSSVHLYMSVSYIWHILKPKCRNDLRPCASASVWRTCVPDRQRV